MKKSYIILGLLLIITAAIVAVAVSKPKNHPIGISTSQNAAATNDVMIQNYMFNPMVIKIKVGTIVVWTNHDSVDHTITADTVSSVAPSSMDIADGKSYSFKFTKSGVYTYHCFPHPYMRGTVEVTN